MTAVLLAVALIAVMIPFSSISVSAGSVIEAAISWAVSIANDTDGLHLYSQSVRWGPSYDCSSFVISAFQNAGVDTGSASWTGNMKSEFTKHGFEWISWSDIGNVSNLQRGDVLLYHNDSTRDGHTEIYLGNNTNVGAHSANRPAADQISVSGYYYHPWQGVLRYNDEPDYVNLGDDFYAYIINTDSWLHATNDNGNVNVHQETHLPNEIWHFERLSNGSYKITSCLDGKCIEVHNFETQNGTNVEMHSYDDNSAQHWFIYGESAQYVLRAECGDNVLDLCGGAESAGDGTNLQMWENNGSDAQKFQIWKLNNDEIPLNLGNDFYSYIINTASWKGLINDGNHNACFSETNDQVKPFWHFTRNPNGSYKIISVYDGQALDCDSGKSENGTNIGVWDSSDVNFQEWFIYGEPAAYYLRPNCTNGVLDMTGGSYYDGVNAQIFERNNTDAQKLQIWKVNFEDVPQNVGDDFYAYVINTNSWKSLANDGEHHALFNENLPDNQKIWHFTRKDTGAYKIKSVYDGNVLDVDLSNSESGTDVGVWTDSNTINQEWYVYGESARYYLKPRCSDCVLDMCGGEYYDNVNAQIFTRIFSNAQLFQIWKLDEPNLIAPNVTIENIIDSENNIKFTWNGCEGATGYDISIFDSAGDELLYMIYNVQGTTYFAAIPDGEYIAEVTAINNRFNMYSFGTRTSFEVHQYTIIGEISLDGTIDVRDCTAIQRYLAEYETLTDNQLAAADTNGDGEVTIEDVTYLQMYLAEYDVTLG